MTIPNPCNACHAACCKTGKVQIYPADVRKWRAAGKGFAGSVVDGVDEKGRPIWVLAKKIIGQECVFLVGRICIIYDERPLVCRVYPRNTTRECKKGVRFPPYDAALVSEYNVALAEWNQLQSKEAKKT